MNKLSVQIPISFMYTYVMTIIFIFYLDEDCRTFKCHTLTSQNYRPVYLVIFKKQKKMFVFYVLELRVLI